MIFSRKTKRIELIMNQINPSNDV